jgi:hypothetical protein
MGKRNSSVYTAAYASQKTTTATGKSNSKCNNPSLPPGPCESEIRLRLFNRLGIRMKEPPISSAAPIDQRRKHAIRSNSGTIAQSVVPFSQPLKDDGESSEEHYHQQQNTRLIPPSLSSSPVEEQQNQDDYDRSHRRIQFASNVMVVPIPSRHAYSKRIKQAFWMDGRELQQTAERNRYEFASEGWDFHQVLEDEDMYMDAATGQLVHPCWVELEDDDLDDYDNNMEFHSKCNGNSVIENMDVDDGETETEEEYHNVHCPTLKRTNSGVFGLHELGDGFKNSEEILHPGSQYTVYS